MIELKNSHFTLFLDETARAVCIRDSAGRTVCAEPSIPFASLLLQGRVLDASSAVFSAGRLVCEFAQTELLVLAVEEKPECLIFIVESCPSCDGVVFAKMAFPGMDLMGMALNSHTTGAETICRANEAGAAAPLRAEAISACGLAGAQAFARFGLVGASYAVLAAAGHEELHRLARAAVAACTTDIPYSHRGGAFAADAGNGDLRRSYLMNLTGISEDEVDDWIEMARAFGASQIDFHGGQTFRFGDFRFDPQKYPQDRLSMKRVIDRLHRAGLQASLHTYAQFVSPLSEYVTPHPHPGLAGSLYTLAEDLTADSSAVVVRESTADVSAVTGFFVQNSVHLVIDEEIIRFSAAGGHAFVIAARGEFGTAPAPHRAGARVKHLMQEFGLFVPDGDSELYLEVARRTAEVFNECGFDSIYLDAIDGTSAVQPRDGFPWDRSWYYANRFVSEIMRRTKKEPLLEMSSMWHHFWFYRSRMGAWDHSTRAPKSLLSAHNGANLRSRRSTFMPQNFGWWTYGKADPADTVQTQRLYLDDYEYFASRACRNDWSLSFIVALEDFKAGAELRRAAQLICRYEQLRMNGQSNRIPQSAECLLTNTGELIPVTYRSGSGEQSAPLAVSVEPNASLRLLRVENRPIAVQNDTVCLLSSRDAGALQLFCATTTQADCEEMTDVQRPCLRLRASQTGELGYARFERRFEPLLDVGTPRALGFWVYGDGQNEKLALQLISPKATNSGTADFVIRVDFTGWKYFLLYESNPEMLAEDIWPFSAGGHYNEPPYRAAFDIAKETPVSQTEWHPSRRDVGVYQLTREKIDWHAIESFSVLLGGMKDGDRCEVRLGEVTAFALEGHAVTDPVVYCNDRPLRLKGELPPLTYIEWRDGVCAAFDAAGEARPELTFETPLPPLDCGENRFWTQETDARLTLTIGIG